MIVIRRKAVQLLFLVAIGFATSICQGGVPGDPSPVDAPQSIEKIPCPPSEPPLDFGLLKPQSDWKPPPFQSISGILDGLRRQMQIDPQGLCHYRTENRALGSPTAHRVVFLGDSITEGWKAAAPAFFSQAILNRGISGQNISQLLLRFREDALNLRPEVIHILAVSMI